MSDTETWRQPNIEPRWLARIRRWTRPNERIQAGIIQIPYEPDGTSVWSRDAVHLVMTAAGYELMPNLEDA